MTIAVIGTGFVGVVTAAAFAKFSNQVYGLDIDEAKIKKLQKAELPFFEPGLEELVTSGVKSGQLKFTTSYATAISSAEVIFISVGTPSAPDGQADIKYVLAATQSLAPHLKSDAIVVIKSTVPPSTNSKVEAVIRQHTKKDFQVASVPEFLKEGTAVFDFLNPNRVVVGTTNVRVAKVLTELHQPLEAEVVIVRPESAQMAKYAANAYLAQRITFINQMANLCEKNGADVQEVVAAIGFDERIGGHYWYPGLGYGGSCFDAQTITYLLNSPHVTNQPFQSHFPERKSRQSEILTFPPQSKQVLAFNLEKRQPTISNVHCLTKRWYYGPMVTIKARMGRYLRVTADHPVVTVNSHDQLKVQPAQNITPGDRLILATTLPDLSNSSDIDILDYLFQHPQDIKIKVRTQDNYFADTALKFARLIPKYLLKHPYQIRKTNCLSIAVYQFLAQKQLINADHEKLYLFTAKGKPTYCPAIFPLNQNTLRLLGYYTAEGWISHDIGRKKAIRDRIGFTFHKNETEYQQDLKQILASLKIRWIEKISGNTWSAIISSKPLALLIKDILDCGTHSNNKHLPKVVFNVSPELKLAYLQGAWSGDGSISTVQQGRNVMLEYATTSKSLAESMTLLLQSLGIIPSIRHRWLTKSKHLAYIIRISGIHQIEALQDIFGQTRRKILLHLLKGYQKRIRQSGFQKYPHYATVEISSVDTKQAKEFVYSMETSAGTLLTNSGIVVHNCFPKDVKELAAYSRAIGEGDGLFVKIDELNEARIPKLVHKWDKQVKFSGKTVAVLGLSFKPNTSDIREAPARQVIPLLQSLGAKVKAYDPEALEESKSLYQKIDLAQSVLDAAKLADVLLLLIEWDEFKSLDFNKLKRVMKSHVLIDTRNQYQPEDVRRHGFTYIGIGR